MKQLPSRPKTVFVIYSPSRDLYSMGGICGSWGARWGKGKIWKTLGHVKTHLSQYRHYKDELRSDLKNLKEFYKEDDYVMAMKPSEVEIIATVYEIFLHPEKYKYKAN